tara:strand:+ start:2198 stop:2668 length:471 start_codon:yes stop_codon:yes gene_type:complete
MNRKETLQTIRTSVQATPILHRCKSTIYCENAGWRTHRCNHLTNRLMAKGEYIRDDGKCPHCKSKDSLEPVQSYLGDEYTDVLTSKRNPNSKEEKTHPLNTSDTHVVLYINVNGKQPREKGRFVKVIKQMTKKESFVLHHRFSKKRDIIQVEDCNK